MVNKVVGGGGGTSKYSQLPHYGQVPRISGLCGRTDTTATAETGRPELQSTIGVSFVVWVKVVFFFSSDLGGCSWEIHVDGLCVLFVTL